MSQQDSLQVPSAAALVLMEGVNTVFESLGRGLVCLDGDFRVVHVSEGLDPLLGDAAAERLPGRGAEEIFGAELFGPEGSMRRALEAGEKREGWGASLEVETGRSRLVSVTGAPLCRRLPQACDVGVRYLVVVRPASEQVQHGSGSAPTLFAGLVARSASMLSIFHLVENLEESEPTVLITGESGTGKELVARAIHLHSPRRRGPFVAVNCGALPAELMESELFGHVRGSFTGAVRDRIGRFELASEGTLFLDEVGELALPLQVKLLRVLQQRSFERVGESTSRRSEARVIAATNLDLKRAVLEGRFRDDLYYRLRVVPVEVPPLRERREDIEPLARVLLSRVGARYGRSMILAPDALRVLLRYPWPGNVREMENALEFAVAVGKGQTLHAEDLPPEILVALDNPLAVPLRSHETAEVASMGQPPSPSAPPPALPDPAAPVAHPVQPPAVTERETLRAALEAHQWRREETARFLGISRTTLWRKMRELGL